MNRVKQILPGTGWAGKVMISYEETDSTNVRARVAAMDGALHGTLVTAAKQTAGRGRRGRSWESPAGRNIYFTLILKPDFDPDQASMLTLVMSCAVTESIKQIAGLDCGIKWPNDIVVNGKKVCGILTEMSADKGKINYVLIGVGINVGNQEFAPELADKATSLEKEAGTGMCRDELLSEIMRAFEKDYESFAECGNLKPLREAYNALLVNRNARVRVLDPREEYEGKALGITNTGELLVEKEDGSLVEVYAGEVSVRGIYGYV